MMCREKNEGLRPTHDVSGQSIKLLHQFTYKEKLIKKKLHHKEVDEEKLIEESSTTKKFTH